MKNTTQIIIVLIVFASIIAFVKYKKGDKSNFETEKDKDKPKRRKCYRVNKAGNGLEEYNCSSAKI